MKRLLLLCALLLAASTIQASDFTTKLQSVGLTLHADAPSGKKVELSAVPTYAYVNIELDGGLPADKSAPDRDGIIQFYSANGEYFHRTLSVGIQGSSVPKQNLSIAFNKDIQFSTAWVDQDEYHLKAFQDDGLRGSAEVAYQLYGQITQRDAQMGTPKGFPISLYVNGSFYGVMSWQIKKARKNMGLVKDNALHVWVDATSDKNFFVDALNWAKIEVRNPKVLFNTDGSEYDSDEPQELLGTNSSAYDASNPDMVSCAKAKQSIQQFHNYYNELTALESSGASTATMRSEISKRYDVPELINYMIFSLVTSNYDGFSKNWQWFTYDGTKWTVAPYDCELTFGYNDDDVTTLWRSGQSSKKYNYRMTNNISNGPMLWITRYFWQDVQSRYASLRRAGTLSASKVLGLINSWANTISSTNYQQEFRRWPASPIQWNRQESAARLEQWVTERFMLNDAYLGYTTAYTLEVTDAGYATICIPFDFTPSANMTVYEITGVDSNDLLLLSKVNNPTANHPYLVKAPKGSYKLSLTADPAELVDPSFLSQGLLMGIYLNASAPLKSYVLQQKESKVAFYLVNTNDIKMSPTHAYLSLSNQKGAPRLVFDDEDADNGDEATSLSQLPADASALRFFSPSGQSLSAPQSGINILLLPDGTTKKVVIK